MKINIGIFAGAPLAGRFSPSRSYHLRWRAAAAAMLLGGTIAVPAQAVLTKFNYTGEVQSYLISAPGYYTMTVVGSAGGYGIFGGGIFYGGHSTLGGKGAYLLASYEFRAGDVLKIGVGNVGASSNWLNNTQTHRVNIGGSGGGASFIAVDRAGVVKPLMVAAGGGGGGRDAAGSGGSVDFEGYEDAAARDGTGGPEYGPRHCYGRGFALGRGGTVDRCVPDIYNQRERLGGAGGGGYFTNGQDTGVFDPNFDEIIRNTGGHALSLGQTGTFSDKFTNARTFGGGGSGHWYGGGGGGGYNGGGGGGGGNTGNYNAGGGGGGGSFLSQDRDFVIRDGYDQIVPTPIVAFGDYQAGRGFISLEEFGLAVGVPEPTSWAMLIAGFGLTGSAMRRARRKAKVAISQASVPELS